MKTIRGVTISKEEVYKATDPTYAKCIVCLVKPKRKCIICHDTICEQHSKRVIGPDECPLCYAIEEVYARKTFLRVLRIVHDRKQSEVTRRHFTNVR